MNIASRPIINAVTTAIQAAVKPDSVANYEIAKYYVGIMINTASELNVKAGHIISRATLSTNYAISGTECIYKGKRVKLSSLSFWKKLETLDEIAAEVGVKKNTAIKLSSLRNLPAHATIVMSENGEALLWDKYDINAAFANKIQDQLDNFLKEAQMLEEYCKEIIKKLDAKVNAGR